MSEINCFGDEIIYSEIVPDWFLVRLVNVIPKEYIVNGSVMGEGHLGLSQLNDPSFVFAMDPIPWNKEWDNNEEINAEEAKYWEVYHHYRDRLRGDLQTCHSLVRACSEISSTDISLYASLMDRMASVIKLGPIKEYRR